ncbi:MAG: galactose-1-phosphate uridylyltransferase [Candidatus Woesearchaeota archaeon]
MELRKDYVLDRFVIIAEKREKRPKQFVEEDIQKDEKVCYFCPGNEAFTPAEIGRIGAPWKIRVFSNKFAAVMEAGNPNLKTDNIFYTFSDAYGRHEVIVETNDHKKQLWDLSKEEIVDILGVYRQRINEISQHPNTKYVLIFKNHGPKGGTSLVHSHTQLTSYSFIPPYVQEKINAAKKFSYCPYCDIIRREKDSFRRCFENETFVAFTPYASRFNFEIWILPKQHLANLNDFDDKKLHDLADIMKNILLKLKKLNCSYNYYIHYSPEGESLHFMIEVCPRIATWAGFEMGSNIIINSVSPETAASFYRGENGNSS